ncbi:MAG TPA: hypothetical protein H9909_06395 [Candidatus Mediterraneibacter norfolkensis]|nr:hypothetical protein [Candidatus Mediterraneibacter norfolkensis]
MRLTGIGANNGIFNAAAINQKVSRLNNDNTAQADLAIQQSNRDSVFISGQGKKQSIIQQLMDQKQLIQESRDAEMKRGLEGGYVNQDKIDEYDKQLEMLDKQIAEATAKQFEEDGEEKDSALAADNKVMTEEEYEQRKMMDIMDLSSGVDQAEIVSSAKAKMDGEARVLKAEIKSDGGNALDSKMERIKEIEARSSDLLEQVGDKIADINENVTQSKSEVNVPVEEGIAEDKVDTVSAEESAEKAGDSQNLKEN